MADEHECHGPPADEWSTFIQWMRGTAEYPNDGGFAGDVGRRLETLEGNYKKLAEGLTGLPDAIGRQTAASITEAFRVNAIIVANAKRIEDDTTELARRKIITDRRTAVSGRAIAAVIGVGVIVFGALIVAVVNSWLAVHH